MNILSLIEQYEDLYLKHKISIGLANNSINTISRAIKSFKLYIATQGNILTIDKIDKLLISNYLVYLSNCCLATSSQQLYLTILKCFLTYVAECNHEYDFIYKNLNGIHLKVAQKEKLGFSQLELKTLVEYIEYLDSKTGFLSKRNALILKVLLYTGIRISELINIQWQDIVEYEDDKHGLIYTILIKGKGNKERYTYIAHNKICSNLDYLHTYHISSKYVICSTRGNQCNRSVIFTVIKRLLLKAGINKSGLHIFRHTFARSLVNRNINLSTIKELLGHSNIAITAQFYAKSNEGAKRQALIV